MDAVISNKRMTIGDIARLAGVAKSTVSEVVNNDPKSRVSRKTFEKVQKIIQQYNYIPLPQAQALTTRKTRQIGFLVSATATLGLANNFFAQILAGIENACMERDYRCVVTRLDLSNVESFVTPVKLRQRNVDALIIAGIFGDSSEMLRNLGIPIAVIGKSHSKHFFQVSQDCETNYCKIFKYLAGEGHRRVLLPYYYENEYHEQKNGMDRCNMEIGRVMTPLFVSEFHALNDFARGEKLAELVLCDAAYRDCTALVSNDQVCCGFMQKFFSHGKKIPDDFSVVSSNDSALCQWNLIPVSACESKTYEHGYITSNLMIDFLEGSRDSGEVSRETGLLNVEDPLIIRKSSGPVPKKYGIQNT